MTIMSKSGAMMLALSLVVLAGPVQAADWSGYAGVGNSETGYGSSQYAIARHDRRWVPARYETRTKVVLAEPAHYDQQYIPPEYRTRCDMYGRPHRVLVRPGRWHNVYVPARYETVWSQVLVPGHWEHGDPGCHTNSNGGYAGGYTDSYSADQGGEREGYYRQPETDYRSGTTREQYSDRPEPEIRGGTSRELNLGRPQNRNAVPRTIKANTVSR